MTLLFLSPAISGTSVLEPNHDLGFADSSGMRELLPAKTVRVRTDLKGIFKNSVLCCRESCAATLRSASGLSRISRGSGFPASTAVIGGGVLR